MLEEALSEKPENMQSQQEVNTDEETAVVGKLFAGEITPEELEDIPPEVLKKELSTFSAEIHHDGPLPAPWILRGYENILPGFADRMLQSVEKEQSRRFEMDLLCQETDARDSKMGIVSATVLGVTTILGGVAIAFIAPGTAGAVVGALLGASGLAAIVGTFIKGTKATWKINSEKDNHQDAKG